MSNTDLSTDEGRESRVTSSSSFSAVPRPFRRYFMSFVIDHLELDAHSQARKSPSAAAVAKQVATLGSAFDEALSAGDFRSSSKSLLERAAALTEEELEAGFTIDEHSLPSVPLERVYRFILSKSGKVLDEANQPIAKITPATALKNSWKCVPTMLRNDKGPGDSLKTYLSDLEAFSQTLTEVLIVDEETQSWCLSCIGWSKGSSGESSLEVVDLLEENWQESVERRRAAEELARLTRTGNRNTGSRANALMSESYERPESAFSALSGSRSMW